MTKIAGIWLPIITPFADGAVEVEAIADLYQRMQRNDHQGAGTVWRQIEALIPLLFKEANPMPIKHLLWRQGVIASRECRLPLAEVSPALARELEESVLMPSAA